jgi:hypothetical protein
MIKIPASPAAGLVNPTAMTIPPPADPALLSVLGAALALLAALSLARRMRAGATPAELLRARAGEIFALRLVAHVIHLGLWWMALRLGLATLGAVFEAFGADAGFLAKFPFRLAIAALAATGLALTWLAQVIRRPAGDPQPVALPPGGVADGIPDDDFLALGSETYPSPVTARDAREWLPRLLVLAGCAGFCTAVIAGDEQEHPLLHFASHLPLAPVALAGRLLQPAGVTVCAFLVVVGVTALAAQLFWNRSYGLLRFPRALGAAAALALAAAAGHHGLAADVDGTLVLMAWLAAAIGLRCLADLLKARAYLSMRRVADPIAADIRETGLRLESLPARPDCALPPVDNQAAARRIALGCRNAEATDPLIQRNFARFLRLHGVEIRHTCIATRRFLTVGRFVSDCAAGGTSQWLRDPLVPAWDEDLFPLRAPDGYVNWLDPLPLAPLWDRVATCGNCAGSGRANCGTCGGSGSVTDSQNRRSTCGTCGGSGRVTCAPCGGQGRILYRRVLNTSWKRLMPTHSNPATGMPELLEDAEERVYFHAPFIEDRQPAGATCGHDGLAPDLVEQLAGAAGQLQDQQDRHGAAVVKLHGARYLYRSDFIVAGFWTLRIRCGWLRGGIGWFFGKRPEFHFPQLPLSFGNWGALAVGIPLAAGLFFHWQEALAALIRSWVP